MYLSQKNWRCGDDRVIISVLVYFQVHRRRVPESRAKKHTCLFNLLAFWPYESSGRNIYVPEK